MLTLRRLALASAAAVALAVTAAAAAVAVAIPLAHAQETMPAVSMCQAIAKSIPGARYVPAALARPAASNEYDVTIRYVGHSTFRITSPEGITAATDYAGFAGEGPTPDVVTMNHAHSSHYTNTPDPAIRHVLRGWNPEGGKAEHHELIGDVLVRNVPTDIRRYGMVEPYGNSIFIFETAGLCIGHLGHLHHVPSDEHYAEIGRLDILFVPVDGGYTMAQPAMNEVVQRVRASIIIPMHFFTVYNLQRFVEAMRSDFAIDIRSEPELGVSIDTLPRTPTVVVVPAY
jgi:L-ascorbate metabolism protein UlaG (beta-lactamase superfamily)